MKPYTGGWALVNAITIPAVPRGGRTSEPHVRLKVCPFCEEILTVTTFECKNCGQIAREKKS